jgi:hypothetical protein
MSVLSTLRTPLKDLNVNLRHQGTELTPYKQGRILSAHVGGMSPREIELAMNHSKGAIAGIIALKILRSNGNSLPHKGQPVLYNKQDHQSILQNIQSYPKLMFQQRHNDTGLEMSNSYIKDLAYANGITYWCVKKRPELSPKNMANHFLWCKVRRHWTVDD